MKNFTDLSRYAVAQFAVWMTLLPLFLSFGCSQLVTSLAKNNFENGKWVILTAYYTGTFASLSIRHFVPLLFILYVLALPVLLLYSSVLILPFLLHGMLNLYFSVKTGLRAKNILLIPLVWFSFFLLHLSYGSGSIAGLLKIAIKKK